MLPGDQSELLRWLDDAARLREQQSELAKRLDYLFANDERLCKWAEEEGEMPELSGYPPLRQVWNDFLSAGGITSHDLRQFLAGKELRQLLDGPLRGHKLRSKRHLRLLVNNKSKPRKPTHKLPNPGNDAA